VRNEKGGATGDGTPSIKWQDGNKPPFTPSPQKTQARADAADALQIAYDLTEDLPNGQPWPPDGADYWAVVARGGSLTRWRRIFLETTDNQSGAVTLDGGLQRDQRRNGE
jgi:hypothetical protein